MATKKSHTKQTHHKKPLHSRDAFTREILISVIFGALLLVFLTLSIINTTSPF